MSISSNSNEDRIKEAIIFCSLVITSSNCFLLPLMESSFATRTILQSVNQQIPSIFILQTFFKTKNKIRPISLPLKYILILNTRCRCSNLQGNKGLYNCVGLFLKKWHSTGSSLLFPHLPRVSVGFVW